MRKIGTRLALGIGVLLGLCAVIGIVSYTETRMVRAKVEEMAQVREPLNSTVVAMQNTLVETAFAALGYDATGDTALLNAFYRNRDRFARIEREYRSLNDSLGQGPVDARLATGFELFRTRAADQITLRDLQSAKVSELLNNVDQINTLLTERIQGSISADDPVAFRRLQAALEMKVRAVALTKTIWNYVLTGREEYEARFRRIEAEFQRYLQLYEIVLLSREERGYAAELRGLARAGFACGREIIALQKQRTERETEFLALVRDMGAMFDGHLRLRTAGDLSQARRELLEAGERADTTVLVVLLVSLAFGVWAGAITTRQIARPVRQLASVMNAVARGDRGQKVELHSCDELRMLGESFNLMTGQLEAAERERSATLKNYASSIQRAQEEERGRISRELHDDLSQRLTGVKFIVEGLGDEIRSVNRRAARLLRDVTDELEKAIVEVRRISSNLRPSVLDDFGLVSALRMLCRDFEKQYHVPSLCEVRDAASADIDGDVETALYRIAQEALANVGKHAGATEVAVRLARDGGGLTLTVEDNGRGFDPERAGGSGGMGLLSMRERASLFGGECTIAAGAGGGTTITVTIPEGWVHA
jgi:signal transduction histidine kinase